MIDKLQSNLPTSYTNSINQVSKSQLGVSGETTRIGNISAEIKLSDEALALQRSIQAVKEAPDVRHDMVQVIQQQLKAGTYQIDVGGLAEKLLPFMK